MEDTILGQLFYYDLDGNEYPAFDISLAPGDILSFTGVYDNPIELIVSDTLTVNGLKQIDFLDPILMCSFEAKFSMIESVGPNVGIHNIGRYYGCCSSNYLLCNYKNGNLYYGNEIFNNFLFNFYFSWRTNS